MLLTQFRLNLAPLITLTLALGVARYVVRSGWKSTWEEAKELQMDHFLFFSFHFSWILVVFRIVSLLIASLCSHSLLIWGCINRKFALLIFSFFFFNW